MYKIIDIKNIIEVLLIIPIFLMQELISSLLDVLNKNRNSIVRVLSNYPFNSCGENQLTGLSDKWEWIVQMILREFLFKDYTLNPKQSNRGLYTSSNVNDLYPKDLQGHLGLTNRKGALKIPVTPKKNKTHNYNFSESFKFAYYYSQKLF